MKRKGSVASIALILVIMNIHRYNLPVRVAFIEVFDLLNVYCWLLAVTLLFMYEARAWLKSVYVFSGLGILNALLNETIFVATLPAWSEWLGMLGAVIISILFYYYYTKWQQKRNP